MLGRGKSAPSEQTGVAGHYGVIVRDDPLALEDVKLMTSGMEIREGVLVLTHFYMGNSLFTDGLQDLARQHVGTFEEIRQLELSVAQILDDPGEGRFLDSTRDKQTAETVGQSLQIWNSPDCREYMIALMRYRHQWNLVGVDDGNEALWQAMAHGQVAALVGLVPWRDQIDELVSNCLWGKQTSRTIEVSLFDMVRHGVKQAVLSQSHKLRPSLHRPHARRSESLTWLYLRLAEVLPPLQIAEKYDEPEEKNVARLIKRDAKLLGLKLPIGRPRVKVKR